MMLMMRLCLGGKWLESGVILHYELSLYMNSGLRLVWQDTSDGRFGILHKESITHWSSTVIIRRNIVVIGPFIQYGAEKGFEAA